MKVSVIGAGNVGATLAQRIAEADIADVVLLDIAQGLAKGKGLDLSDARSIIGYDRDIMGTGDYNDIADSKIVVVTAGLARQPGMTREDLVNKNTATIKKIIACICEKAPQAIIIMVTNPLDILTNIALKISGFNPKKVIGMGGVLDSSRFANLIAERLNASPSEIEAMVIGAHGQSMLPLPRFTKVAGKKLTELLSDAECAELSKDTVNRGAQIVECLGNGSAYYAPSAAAFSMVQAILKDEKKLLSACVYLNGEYGIKDVCIGVPIILGAFGVEQIFELELTKQETENLVSSANAVKSAVAALS
ncbi:MAG: malate dehydrogenase [Candidatus Omnitrophica bacterium]|nr:malate dehydrogenase [Candidatus Omnitrophota bacterium]